MSARSEINLGANPSIGAIGRVEFDPISQRLKGIILPPVYDQDQLTQAMQTHVMPLVGQLDGWGRVTARVLVGGKINSASVIDPLATCHHGIVIQPEAYISLGPNDLNLNGVLYLGGNTLDRTPRLETVKAEGQTLQQAQLETQDIRPMDLPPNYATQLVLPQSLDGINDQDIRDILAIYKGAYKGYLVDFTEESIKANAYSSAVGLVRDPSGKIVSVTMGEITPPFADHIRFCEISDSATDMTLKDRDPQAKNVNFWAKREILRFLVHQNIQVIYTETRANWKSVLKSNLWLGLEPRGYLPRHCKISSTLESVTDQEDKGFGNLFVMSLSENARQFYLSQQQKC